MMMLLPKFGPQQLSFSQLSESERLEIITHAKELASGQLTEMPELPRKFPHLACVLSKAGNQPMMIVCPSWEDIFTIQNTTEFDQADSVNWYAIGDWNSV